MFQLDILEEKVIHGGSDWTSPVVPIKKTDGYVRICGDDKIGVNHQICSYSFPLPRIKNVSHELSNMKHFEKIDLKSVYNQIEIKDKLKEITTLNTPKALLRWSCLSLGIKTASHIFQRAIEKILLGKVDNILIYQDDICLAARTRVKRNKSYRD